MKITLAQINTIVGDVAGNQQLIIDHLDAARSAGADLIAFPELCISGYPPQDLVERPRFIAQCEEALRAIQETSRATPGLGIVVGLPLPSGVSEGKPVANALVLICDGEVVHRQDKSLLPTYDVFDEARYFEPASEVTPVEFKGELLGLSVCEDAWNDPELFRRRPYKTDPIAVLADRGATVMVNISASPFSVDKELFRRNLIGSHATRHRVPFVFVNQVGGNDSLVFDGRSLYVGADGAVRAALPMFEEAVVTVDTVTSGPPADYQCLPEIDSVRGALVLGIRDYMRKCGFKTAVVGVSGGIDSAVTLALAAEAIGAEQLTGIAMPSPYSSQGSVEDARALCANLGVTLEEVPIGPIMAAYGAALDGALAGAPVGLTEENIQARIRGNILMAYSNTFGSLVLSTGNKSELAVGYCTLYGDMSGGLAAISDVPKTMVYQLAAHMNRERTVIPATIIEKAPSAELRPGQRDEDSLPPYATLDAILDLYIEEALSVEDIVDRGHDAQTVRWVVDALRRTEYKRKQAAPGIKVTSKAFGVGRRLPIAARYTV